MSARLLLLSGALAFAAILGVLAFVAASPSGTQKSGPITAQNVRSSYIAPPPLADALPTSPPSPASEEPFVVKRVLPIQGPIKYGEWHWDDNGIPDGPLVITVDLDARVISVFRGGYEIGAAAVLLGTDEKPTPLGVFPIMQKRKEYYSNTYSGAPMPFMQRLTNDGVALHGSNVERGYASHGCVGMPNSFAAKLFDETKVGDKVYITRGKTIGMGDALIEP